MNNISFYPASRQVELIVPMPKPAKSYIPQWYKDVKVLDGEKPKLYNGQVINKNIKSCVPFLDSFNTGYIQETWCDVYISCKGNSFEYHSAYGPEIISHRDRVDMKLSDVFINAEFVWRIPWVPKTTSGYSVIYTHPLNHLNLPFVSGSGVVDSDTFYHSSGGNFPFYVYKDFEGIIPKGTPMYQIIPMKRDSWESFQEEFVEEEAMVRNSKSSSFFIGAYRRFFHQKKNFS